MTEGFTEIKLTRPMTINGVQVNVLKMREPTVEDQLAADKIGNGESRATELALFANLCEVTPDDIKKMTLRDYAKVQQAFLGFIS